MKKQVRQIEACHASWMRCNPDSRTDPKGWRFGAYRPIHSTRGKPSRRGGLSIRSRIAASKARTPLSGHRPVVLISVGDVISAHGLGILLSPGLWV